MESKTKQDKGVLTEADVNAVVTALKKEYERPCRFAGIAEEELKEVIKFHRHWNQIAEETSSTARKTFVALVVAASVGAFITGVVVKVKTHFGAG